jgi:hypothetical protein
LISTFAVRQIERENAQTPADCLTDFPWETVSKNKRHNTSRPKTLARKIFATTPRMAGRSYGALHPPRGITTRFLFCNATDQTLRMGPKPCVRPGCDGALAKLVREVEAAATRFPIREKSGLVRVVGLASGGRFDSWGNSRGAGIRA